MKRRAADAGGRVGTRRREGACGWVGSLQGKSIFGELSRGQGSHGEAAVQLSRRAKRRKPGGAIQWMSTDNEAEKVDSSVATSRLSGGKSCKDRQAPRG